MAKGNVKKREARKQQLKLMVRPLLHLASSPRFASSIIRATEADKLQTLLFTSCHDGEGKTVAAINVAYSLARKAKKKVLLVDANPVTPNLHKLFNLSISPGFVQLIMGEARASEVMHKVGLGNLAVLPLGSDSDKWLSWTRPQQLEKELNVLKNHFEFIVVDGPSIFGAVDTASFAQEFDGVVIVVECERTRKEILNYAEERLDHANTRILGAIMNRRKFYIPEALYES